MDGIAVVRPRYIHFPAGDKRLWPHRAFSAATERLLLTGKVDILHAHYAYPTGYAAAQVHLKMGVPWILTLHGGDVNHYPATSRLCRKRFCKTVRWAPRVFAVSGALAGRTCEISGVLPTVMPIGVRISSYSELPSRNAAQRLLGLPAGKRLVLFVGNLVREKGVQVLLSALEHCDVPDICGVFVGTGPMVEQIRDSRFAIAFGGVKNERIPLLMAGCDVFVLPSFSEGLPTVVVEAGAAGLPVIAGNVGGLPELLGDNRGLLTNPGSERELIGALRSTLFSPDVSKQRAEKLRKYVQSYYNVDDNARIIVRQYTEAIEAFRQAWPDMRSSCKN